MEQDGLRVVKRIVVAVALRPESVGAAEVAREIADRMGVELHIVHVIEPLPPGEAEAIPGAAEAHQHHWEQETELFIESHSLREAGTVHVVSGDPVHETLRLVRTLDADLLAFGRIGARAKDIGSVATRLAAKSPVSCLIVPETQRGMPERVGVAVDFTPQGECAARRGARTAKRLGLDEIVLLHAYQLPRGYHTIMSHEEAVERLGQVCQARTTLLSEKLASEGVKVRCSAEAGDVSEVIERLAVEERIELLVVRVHRSGRTHEFAVGRHAENILRRIRCAAWVEKPVSGDAARAAAVDKLLGLS